MTRKFLQLTFFFAFLFVQKDACAQWSAGGGLILGTQVESIGINLRVQKDIMEKIDGAGYLNYFFGSGANLLSLNADGHYDFSKNDKFVFYGLGGLNFSRISYANNTFFGGSYSRIGLNLGAGANMKVKEKITGFGEIKYIASSLDQLVISAGVLFPFGE